MLSLVSFIVFRLTVQIITSWELPGLSYTCKYLHQSSRPPHGRWSTTQIGQLVKPREIHSSSRWCLSPLDIFYCRNTTHFTLFPLCTLHSQLIDQGRQIFRLNLQKSFVLLFKFNFYIPNDKTLHTWLQSYQTARSIKLLTDYNACYPTTRKV